MVGIAGAGKTTLAKTKYSSFDRISLDDIRQDRAELNRLSATWSPDGLAEPTSQERKAEHVKISASLKAGRNILIDDTNLTRDIRAHHIEHGKQYDYEIQAVLFRNLDRALQQNRRRGGTIPDFVIQNRWNELEMSELDEGFDSICVIPT